MRNTIKKHIDFQMPEDGPVARMPIFIARCRPTKWPGDAQYGLIVTKRTFKRAVDRNRAKRLLRAWLLENETGMHPDKDYIFIARSDILGTDKPSGVAMMKKALRQLDKFGG